MENCVFCRMLRKEIPAAVVGETDRALAVLDIQPRAPGHTMVISKTHAPNLAELPPEEVGPVFDLVRTMARRLAGALGADGLTLGINQGEVSGQTVPHLHIHLLPRFRSDGGGSVHSVVSNPPGEDRETIQKKINDFP